jgi:hypothetical protein
MTPTEAILDGDRNWLVQRVEEWKAERRYLSHRIQEDKRRFEELCDILKQFEGVRG